MRRHGLALFALLLPLGLVFPCSGASSQEVATSVTGQAPAVGILTLRQAITQALLRNPNRLRAGHDITTAGFQRDAAEWGRYPRLSVDAGAGQANTTFVPTTTVRLEQPLWAGGRIDAQVNSAEAQLSAAEYAETEARRRLAEDTAVTYQAWLDAAQRAQIAREGVDALSDLFSYVERRERGGLASASDVSIAQARRSSALALVEQMRGELEQARAVVQALTLLDAASGVPVDVPPISEPSSAAVEDAYVRNAPLLAQRRSDVENARAQAAVQRGQMMPTVALRLEYLHYQHNAPVGPSADSRALVVLQFSPDAGLSSYSAYQAAGSRVDSALAQLASDDNDTRLRARANWSDYLASSRQFEALQPQVASLDAASGSFMRQFEAGRKSWLEVLNTTREIIDAKLALSRARTARDQAALRLMVNTGTFSTWLETLPQ